MSLENKFFLVPISFNYCKELTKFTFQFALNSFSFHVKKRKVLKIFVQYSISKAICKGDLID